MWFVASSQEQWEAQGLVWPVPAQGLALGGPGALHTGVCLDTALAAPAPPGEPQSSADTVAQVSLEAVQEIQPWGEQLLWKTKTSTLKELKCY